MPLPDYSRINPVIRQSIDNYVKYQIPPGDFLLAVYENNLMEAFGRADEGNIENMFHICAYIYNETPNACHGSPERVRAWLEHKK